jgi:hypothetical protein
MTEELAPAIKRILDQLPKYRWSGLPHTGNELEDWKLTPPPQRVVDKAAESVAWFDPEKWS